MIDVQANKSDNVLKWYKQQYPTDSFVNDMNDDFTFEDMSKVFDGERVSDNFEKLVFKNNAYDSLVRERLFTKLSKMENKDYDFYYYRWIGLKN